MRRHANLHDLLRIFAILLVMYSLCNMLYTSTELAESETMMNPPVSVGMSLPLQNQVANGSRSFQAKRSSEQVPSYMTSPQYNVGSQQTPRLSTNKNPSQRQSYNSPTIVLQSTLADEKEYGAYRHRSSTTTNEHNVHRFEDTMMLPQNGISTPLVARPQEMEGLQSHSNSLRLSSGVESDQNSPMLSSQKRTAILVPTPVQGTSAYQNDHDDNVPQETTSKCSLSSSSTWLYGTMRWIRIWFVLLVWTTAMVAGIIMAKRLMNKVFYWDLSSREDSLAYDLAYTTDTDHDDYGSIANLSGHSACWSGSSLDRFDV